MVAIIAPFLGPLFIVAKGVKDMRRQIVSKTLTLILVLGFLVGAGWMTSRAVRATAPIYVRPGGDDTNCDGTVGVDYAAGLTACAVQTIQKGIDLVDAGGIVYVQAGEYVLSSQVNLNKTGITIEGSGSLSTIVKVSGAGYGFYITASGVTIQGLQIEKIDKAAQNIIYIGADDVSIKSNVIFGQYVFGENDTVRAFEVAYGSENLLIEGNTIHSVRQPGYLNGSLASPTTGSIQNNTVYGTRGWVLAGAAPTFTDNSWGTGNIFDIVILAGTDVSYYPDIVTVSAANNDAVVEDQRPNPYLLSVVYVDGAASADGNGGQVQPYQTISQAITRVVAGGTIYIAAGDYTESIAVVDKVMHFVGAIDAGGNPLPRIVGTLSIDHPNAGDALRRIENINFSVGSTGNGIDLKNVDQGVTIKNCTFDGNNLFMSGKNGVNILSGPNGNNHITIDDCTFQNGLYVGVNGYANYLTVKDSSFANVKSGINLQGGGGNLVVENTDFNVVAQTTTADTYGIRFGSSSGSIQNMTVTGGSITVDKAGLTADPGTYHSAIVVRAAASGVLEANNISINGEVVNLSPVNLDAECNYWQTIVMSEIASKVTGPVDWSPWASSDLSTCTYTWPVHNITQATDYQTIQAAIDAANAGDVIQADAGTYVENVIINKSVTLSGAAGAIIDGNNAGIVVTITANGVTLQGFTIQHSGTTANDAGVFLNGVSTCTVTNNTVTGNTSGIAVVVGTNNTISSNVASGNLAYGIAVVAGTGNTINLNTVNGNGLDAIALDNASAVGGSVDIGATDNLIQENIIITSNRDGVFLGENCDSNTVDGNTLSSITSIGVSAWRSGGHTITDNAISGAAAGIRLLGSSNNTITGNILSGNDVGVKVDASWQAGVWYQSENNAIHENDLSGTTTIAVQCGAEQSALVNTSANWWGSAVPATVKTAANGGVLVDYTPWLASGADTSTDPGFQGDFSTLWVDDDSPQIGTTGRIQEGIDLVSGSTVNVAAGTYVEDPVIDKPLTLLGPNAGIDPTTGTRVAEAVILPAYSYPDPAVCETVFWMGDLNAATNVSNITIDGFTVDGDNPALTSGLMIDGADVDACVLMGGWYGYYSNITIANNILKHATYAGIDIANSPSWTTNPTAGNVITHNRFEDIGETTYNIGIGVITHYNVNADITYNFMTGVRIGIQTENITLASPGGPHIISNNTIGAWRLGIFHNTRSGTATPYTLANNTVTAESYPGVTDKWNGILLSVHSGTADTIISNNDITIPDTLSYSNYSAGYNVWSTSSGLLSIDGGTMSGGDYGIFVNNWEGYSSNGNPTLIDINGVTILDSAVAGVYVKDSPSNTNGATVYANIQNSTIDTDATGILVEGADATAKANNNKIVGNPTAGVTNTSGVMMDAEHNWWGNPCGPGATGADSVSANVDYTPWWADEAMTIDGPEAGGEWIVPTGATTPEAQAILNCAAGRTVVFEGGIYPGGLIVNGNQTTINLNGSTVGKGSPAFTINADDVTIKGIGVLDGNGDASPGILVNAGADNFILDGVEVREWANGVQLAGDVTSFKIVSNWIHSNTGNGLLIDADVDLGGVVTIEGNLFKVNGGNGIQHNGNGTLPATYNSWGDVDGPLVGDGDGISASVTYDPWTFAEIYLDVDPVTSGDQVTRNVIANDAFDVAFKVEAQNLYGLAFSYTYSTSLLTLNSTTFTAPWIGRCTNLSTPGEVAYFCYLTAGPEWDGGTVATFNFSANGAGLTGDGPWTAIYDISHLEADTSAGAIGGVKVFVNNAGYNDPSTADRDITDANDGQIIISTLANFTGFINLQGRTDDSGAVIQVYGAAPKASAVLLAQGASVSSGAYTTAYEAGQQLTVGTTYYFQVDRALYVPTTAMKTTTGLLPAVPDDWQNYADLLVRPLTTLNTVILLGGDATDDDMIELSDAVCIGAQYGSAAPVACGTGADFGAGTSADVNGDGKVDLLDLVLMGGNYEKNSSPWIPQ